MSLLDALLLDPAPFNVWIAKRADGLKGSVTASDPYDGSMDLPVEQSLANRRENVEMNLVSMLRTDRFLTSFRRDSPRARQAELL